MYLGVFGAVVSFAVLLYSLVSHFLMRTEPGWTSIISVVLFVGSVNMIMLGIMGEYIGRIFMQSKQRPLFLIESVTRGMRSRRRPPQSGAACLPAGREGLTCRPDFIRSASDHEAPTRP